MFHFANHLVVHYSKIAVQILFRWCQTLVKSFVLFMPACRVNSFSNSWFLVSSQAVITPQMCKRRNHASSRMTDLTVRSKAHRPNQRALSKPDPALHYTSNRDEPWHPFQTLRLKTFSVAAQLLPSAKLKKPRSRYTVSFRLSASVNTYFLPWQNCLKIILLKSISAHQSVKQPQ